MSRFDTVGRDDMNHVAHGVYIGSHYVLKSSHFLLAKGIRHVVNAAIEFITETPELVNWEELHRAGIDVHNTYWDDTLSEVIYPSPSMDQGVQKIDDAVRAGCPVLVNCAMGKSRSTSLVIAYLMARHSHDYDTALAMCKRARPICQPNTNFERQLRSLDMALRAARNQYHPQQDSLSPPYNYGPSAPACEPGRAPAPYYQPPAQSSYTPPYTAPHSPPNYYSPPQSHGHSGGYANGPGGASYQQPSPHPYAQRSVSPPPQVKNYYDNYSGYNANKASPYQMSHNQYFNNNHYYNNQCFNSKRRLSL